MLILAHTGITFGLFKLISQILFKVKRDLSFKNSDPPAKIKVDYRLIFLGSMFPDIIDKPLGMLIFSNLIANGRIYTHTLLVNLLLVFIGTYLTRRKKFNFLIFSLSSCFHLVLDEMWKTPRTLLWPLYGLEFPRGDISHWWEHILYGLLANPWVYVPEIVGGAILFAFCFILIKRNMLGKFLLQGYIE